MSGTLSATTAASLASILQPISAAANVGSAGFNIYDQYKNQQYQNTLRSDAQNPAKVTALAQQYTQPLTAGLTAAVNNSTQAQLAQAGLSESPQIAQTVEAQALAPYVQQNQTQGYNLALQALGLGGGAIPPATAQQNNLSALAKAFSQLPGQGGSNPNELTLLQNLIGLTNPNGPSTIPDPYGGVGSQPPPVDYGSLYSGLGGDSGSADLSSFYSPDYSAAGS